MITCMGIVVGALNSINYNEIAQQCANFLKTYPNLLECLPTFQVDRQELLSVLDYTDDAILCRFYNGRLTTAYL